MNSFTLNLNDFTQFITHTLKISYKEIPDALSLYTQDTDLLILMLEAFYAGLTDHRVKRRFTKVRKQLTNSEVASLDSSTEEESNN